MLTDSNICKQQSRNLFFFTTVWKNLFSVTVTEKRFFQTVNCKKCFSKVFLLGFWSIILKCLFFYMFLPFAFGLQPAIFPKKCKNIKESRHFSVIDWNHNRKTGKNLGKTLEKHFLQFEKIIFSQLLRKKDFFKLLRKKDFFKLLWKKIGCVTVGCKCCCLLLQIEAKNGLFCLSRGVLQHPSNGWVHYSIDTSPLNSAIEACMFINPR